MGIVFLRILYPKINIAIKCEYMLIACNDRRHFLLICSYIYKLPVSY